MKGLQNGNLKLRLNGRRLKGGFTLIPMQGPHGSKNWLLINERDEYAYGSDITERETTSLKSGLTIEEIAARKRGRRHRKAAR